MKSLQSGTYNRSVLRDPLRDCRPLQVYFTVTMRSDAKRMYVLTTLQIDLGRDVEGECSSDILGVPRRQNGAKGLYAATIWRFLAEGVCLNMV
jgi:hypothetical protein